MPATYITDQDRNFSADTGYAPSGANFYAQAGANLMALPSQMQLIEVKGRQLALLNADRQRRKDIFDEESRMEDEDEYAGFTGFVKGISGLDEESRATEISKWKMENPWSLDNERISRASNELFAASDDEIKARDNVLKRRRQALDARTTTYEEDTFEDRQKLEDMRLKTSFDQAALIGEKTTLERQKLVAGDLSGIGSFIASSGAFAEDELDQRNALVALSADLARNKDDGFSRETLGSLADITGALALGNKMPEIFRSKLSRHQRIIRQIATASSKSPDGMIDFGNLPDDPAERTAVIERASKLAAGSPPQVMADFNALINDVAGYDRSKADIQRTKGMLFGQIEKIKELRYSSDPMAKQKIQDVLAEINANASISAGYYQNAFQEEQTDLKRREMESKIENRLSLATGRVRSADQKDRALAQAEYRTEIQNAFRLASTREGRIRMYSKVAEDGTFDLFGFAEDPTPDQFMEKLESINPLPGASGRNL